MTCNRINENQFIQAFNDMNRAENFTYEGRKALYHYFDDIGEPVEFDVIALCCEFSEYKNIKEFNHQQYSNFKNWDDVSDVTTVIQIPGSKAAIVQNY